MSAAPRRAVVVAAYPVALLWLTAVGDCLHYALHWCTDCAKSLGERGWAAVPLASLLRCVGRIHTCHHAYIDAFGNVDRSYEWQNLVLDKIVKRSLHQCLALGSWLGLLRLLARGGAAPARLSAAAGRSMAELIAVEVLRTVWIARSALPRRGGRGEDAAPRPVVAADHPSLAALPPAAALRLTRAVRQRDATQLLLWGVWITPEAHALHHWNWRNFPFQYIDWCAVLAAVSATKVPLFLPPLESVGLAE